MHPPHNQRQQGFDRKMTTTLPLRVETALSGRSHCGVCKENIQVGEERIGTQRRYPFKGFLCTTWHHRSCYERPWNLEEGEFVPSCSKTASAKAESKAAFANAARLAVVPSVQEFRQKSLENGPTCPITKNRLDASNSHVHHFGPNDFHGIVKSFLSEKRVALYRVSYTAAQFSHQSLAISFVAYHEKKKRYLLVHESANQGILKRRPSFGPCDVCRHRRNLTWIFQEGVCKKCRKDPSYRRNCMSMRQCLKELGLDAKDLLGQEYQAMENPKSANFAPMRLFRRQQAEKLAQEKYGSVELARAAQQAKHVRQQENRRHQYHLARTFHMALRAPRSTPVLDAHNEELATPGQLRYLRNLGVTAAAGMSKTMASEAITTARSRRKES